MTYEAVIVGAGAAGLSAAIVLASHGVSTLICDSAHVPADAACAEGIPPEGVAALEHLGLSRDELLARGLPLRAVRCASARGYSARAAFSGVGVGITRRELVGLLLARLAALPHAKYLPGVRARLVREQSGARSRFAVQVESSLLYPRLVIGADGLHSPTRRRAGIFAPIPSPARWNIRQRFALSPWSDSLEVHFAEGGQAYVTPVGHDRTNVAFIWEHERLPAGGQQQIVPRLLEHFPELAQRLRDAKRAGRTYATGPLHGAPPRAVRDGLLLIGDAVGSAAALTGEGVGLAARQALLLEELVVPQLLRRDGAALGSRALAPFARAQHLMERGSHSLSSFFSWLRHHPALLERLIGALNRDPSFFHYCVALDQGVAPLRAAPLGNTLALAARVVAPRVHAPPRWAHGRDALRHSS